MMMDDEKNKPQEGSDEYHFAGENTTYEYEAKSPSSELDEMTARLREKRAPIVGVIITLVLIYYTYKFFTSSDTEKDVHKKEITPAAAVVEKKSPAPEVQATVVPPVAPEGVPSALNGAADTTVPKEETPATVSEVVSAAALQEKKLNVPVATSDETALTTRIAALEAQIAKLTALLEAQIQKNETVDSQQATHLTQQMTDLSAEVSQLNQKVLHASVTGTPAAEGPVAESTDKLEKISNSYNIQAIVPGRAWLKGPNNHILTVAVGETIEGWRVVAIDPYAGTVKIQKGRLSVSLNYDSSGGGDADEIN